MQATQDLIDPATEVRNKLQGLKDNPQEFIERFLKIEVIDEDLLSIKQKSLRERGNLYPLLFNDEQQQFYAQFMEQKRQNKPIRFIVLKPRKIGFSTLIDSLVYHYTRFNPNVISLIATHEHPAVTHLFNIIKLFHNEIPPALRPLTKYSNKRELVFENPNPRTRDASPGLQSRIIVDISQPNLGRAFAIAALHASELAYWYSPEEAMGSAMQAIPNSPNTMIVMESTANGFNNYFHKQWLLAKEKVTDFTPVFFPWFQHKSYQKTLNEIWYDTALNSIEKYGDEKKLIELYNLSNEQLFWRRWCIDNKCQENEMLFYQEYPADDIECFISSAVNIFNVRKLHRWYQEAEEGQRGDIREGRFIPCRDGYWEVFEAPQPGITYIAGLDSASGIEGGDYSVCCIMRGDTLDQVAQLRIHIEPNVFTDMSLEGIQLYNNAFTNLELTGGVGWAILDRMKEKYFNLYLWEKLDEFGKIITKKIGWETTGTTKELLINNIKAYINEDWGKIRSKKTIEELMSFVRLPDGKQGAASGAYDDCVIALGLCLVAYKSGQRAFGKPAPAVKQDSFQDIKPSYEYRNGTYYIPHRQETNKNLEYTPMPWGSMR